MEQEKITFEDLQKANETINTTNIKGKDYAEVNQRIKAFRMVYPMGMIRTTMVKNEDGICIFRAEIYDEKYHQLATGTAYERENSTFINKTSYIENCETSAVGRALGMAGFGIDTSVASAEEVQNAMNNQKTTTANKLTKVTLLTDNQKETIKSLYEEDMDTLKAKVSELGKTKLSELTVKEASDLISEKRGKLE